VTVERTVLRWLADSISLDAHKWLYQPLDCTALLYRGAGAAPPLCRHRRVRQAPVRRPGRGLRVLRRIPRAVPPVPGAQAVAAAPLSRHRPIPRRDPRRSRTRATAGTAHHGRAHARAAGAGRAQHSVLPVEGRYRGRAG
jgi:hypothetical protein